MAKPEKIPAYSRVKAELVRFITENQLQKHDLLPSEWQLAAMHRVSVGTVRRALNDLVTENVIYRRHGQGTFVSPRSRKKKILLVPPNRPEAFRAYNDHVEFFLGALDEANAADLACVPEMVDPDDFLANAGDLPTVYPEVEGVIFFRRFSHFEQVRSELLRYKLPVCYYGGIPHWDQSQDIMKIFHNEETIARLVAGRLFAQGINRVGIALLDNNPINLTRAAMLEKVASDYPITVRRLLAGEIADIRMLRLAAAEAEAFFVPCAFAAIQLIQKLERVLRLRVPDDIRVISVDNMPAAELLRPGLTTVDLCNYENGKLCMRLFAEGIASGEGLTRQMDGTLRLVVRESC
ncbi:MAG: substrate-binding domain-containing protein [Lentisphaeria bacterium]|nr:substrate-binding domain-containing protein [Lentisphaeria bacterium]